MDQNLALRIRSEYAEMPGMCLTLAQACRLWQADPEECARVLDTLVREGLLAVTDDGAFVASGASLRRRTAKAQYPAFQMRRRA
jgi:hypothetical protein